MMKTLRSRIAAVAVAALGAGLLSAAPASAATATVAVKTPTTTYGTRTIGIGTVNTVVFSVTGSSGDTFTYSSAKTGAGTISAPAGSGLTCSAGLCTKSNSSPVEATVTVTSAATDSAGKTYTVTAGGVSAVLTVVAPFAISTASGTPVNGTTNASISVEQIAGAGNYVGITATSDTGPDAADTCRYLRVTGSNFANFAGSVAPTYNGSLINCTGSATGNEWTFNGSSYANSTIAIAPDDGVITGDEFWVATPTAGTVKIEYVRRVNNTATGTSTETVAQTITINVVTGLTAQTYTSSTVVEGVTAGVGYTNVNTDGVTTARFIDGAASLTPGFTYTVTQNAGTATIADKYNKQVVATLTGVGNLSTSATVVSGPSIAQRLVIAAETTGNQIAAIGVHGDGRAGSGTLKIEVNGVVVKTYTYTFFGSVASYDVAVNNAYVGVGDTKAALTVTARDAAGVVVPNATVYVKSSSTDVATAGAASVLTSASTDATVYGSADVNVTGVDKGAVTFTFSNLTTSATVSKTASLKVVGTQVKTLTWAFDKSGYLPGEKAVITFTAADSDGNPIGDGARAVFSAAPVSNTAFGGGSTPFVANPTFTSGVAKVTVYMPFATQATVTVTAKFAATTAVAEELRGTSSSITATVADSVTLALIEAAVAGAKAEAAKATAEAAKATAAIEAAKIAAAADAASAALALEAFKAAAAAEAAKAALALEAAKAAAAADAAKNAAAIEAAKAAAAADAAKAAAAIEAAKAAAAADAAKAAAAIEAAKAEAAKATAAVAALSTTVTSIQTAISTLVASTTATLTTLTTKLNKIMKKFNIK